MFKKIILCFSFLCICCCGSNFKINASKQLSAVANIAQKQVGIKRTEKTTSTTPANGFDCSGLTLYCYKIGAGKDIGRTCSIQKTKGRIVGKAELSRGDLVFFYTNWGHVGIYVGNGNVVHSSSSKMKVVQVPIWKDFIGGVKIIENIPKQVALKSGENEKKK